MVSACRDGPAANMRVRALGAMLALETGLSMLTRSLGRPQVEVMRREDNRAHVTHVMAFGEGTEGERTTESTTGVANGAGWVAPAGSLAACRAIAAAAWAKTTYNWRISIAPVIAVHLWTAAGNRVAGKPCRWAAPLQAAMPPRARRPRLHLPSAGPPIPVFRMHASAKREAHFWRLAKCAAALRVNGCLADPGGARLTALEAHLSSWA